MGKTKLVKQRRKRRRWVILTVAGLVAVSVGVTLLSWGFGSSSSSTEEITSSGDRLETVGAGELPSFARQASVKVQEAYRYGGEIRSESISAPGDTMTATTLRLCCA